MTTPISQNWWDESGWLNQPTTRPAPFNYEGTSEYAQPLTVNIQNATAQASNPALSLTGRWQPTERSNKVTAGAGALSSGLSAASASTAGDDFWSTIFSAGASGIQGAAGGAAVGNAPGAVIGGVAGFAGGLVNSWLNVGKVRQQRRDNARKQREIRYLTEKAERAALREQAYERGWQETLRQDALKQAADEMTYREGESKWQHEQRTKEFLASEEGRKWSQEFQEKQLAMTEEEQKFQREEAMKNRKERAEERQYTRGQQTLLNRWNALKYAQERMSAMVSTNQNLKQLFIQTAR
jgi:hypothetical protein